MSKLPRSFYAFCSFLILMTTETCPNRENYLTTWRRCLRERTHKKTETQRVANNENYNDNDEDSLIIFENE